MAIALPTIEGVIDRRILVNFRLDPTTLDTVLPAGLVPQLVEGHAVAGICLIRLTQIRPRGWPARIGVGSENAAHRIAVEWHDHGSRRTGVYIPRRDTNSRLNTLLGGRLFAGVHHRADFDVHEDDTRLRVTMASRDGGGSIAVEAAPTPELPSGSIFDDLHEVSEFFEHGSLGLSPTRGGNLEALELDVANWEVAALDVAHVESSFFGDGERFPDGTVEFDNALLMTGINHRWHQRQGLCACEGDSVDSAAG